MNKVGRLIFLIMILLHTWALSAAFQRLSIQQMAGKRPMVAQQSGGKRQV